MGNEGLKDWLSDYNSRHASSLCPDVTSSSCSKEDLSKWLPVFASEARNQRGERYSPRTLYQIFCGILREMRIHNSEYPNFLNKKDPAFTRFLNTLDNLFNSLRSDGIGAKSSHTEGLSIEEENLLWSSGVLDTTTPKGLL